MLWQQSLYCFQIYCKRSYLFGFTNKNIVLKNCLLPQKVKWRQSRTITRKWTRHEEKQIKVRIVIYRIVIFSKFQLSHIMKFLLSWTSSFRPNKFFCRHCHFRPFHYSTFSSFDLFIIRHSQQIPKSGWFRLCRGFTFVWDMKRRTS